MKNFERFKYSYSNKIDVNKTLKGYYSAVSQIINNPSCAADNSEWEFIGPNTFTDSNNVPFNGIYTSIIGDPNDSNFLIAGTENSGLWKWQPSINGWKNVTNNLNIPGIGITDIIMNPCDPNHLVASTGSKSQGSVTVNVGLLESFDKGSTWTINRAINTNADALNYRITQLKVDSYRSNCSTGDFFYYATRTENGGSACELNEILYIKSNGATTVFNSINTPCGSLCNSSCDWYHKSIMT